MSLYEGFPDTISTDISYTPLHSITSDRPKTSKLEGKFSSQGFAEERLAAVGGGIVGCGGLFAVTLTRSSTDVAGCGISGTDS